MVKSLVYWIVCFIVAIQMAASPAMAQAPRSKQPSVSSGPRKQLATIIFSGLAGAILGLSTLSFYGRPQDHLSNMGVGLAIGIIAGTTYTTWQAATRPHEFYGMGQASYDLDLEPKRLGPEYELVQRDLSFSPEQSVPVSFSYQWSF